PTCRLFPRPRLDSVWIPMRTTHALAVAPAHEFLLAVKISTSASSWPQPHTPSWQAPCRSPRRERRSRNPGNSEDCSVVLAGTPRAYLPRRVTITGKDYSDRDFPMGLRRRLQRRSEKAFFKALLPG